MEITAEVKNFDITYKILISKRDIKHILNHEQRVYFFNEDTTFQIELDLEGLN